MLDDQCHGKNIIKFPMLSWLYSYMLVRSSVSQKACNVSFNGYVVQEIQKYCLGTIENLR